MVLFLGFIAFNGLAFLFLPEDQKVLFGLVSFLVLYSREIRKISPNLIPVIKNVFTKHSINGEVLNELLEAVAVLSKQEVGALILIENHQPITDHSDSGIVIDGMLQAGLIESVFQTYSPLHDGAMVIKEDRIQKVGVILPLTTSPEVPKWFGTRHRAGLGISEVSDCHVIVISEETGEITYFHKGTFKQVHNIGHLRLILDWK